MKLLCSILIVLFLLGCASSYQSPEELSANWEKHYEKCVDTELSSQDKFITNQWFDSLSLDDKKSVALYVYQSNFYACHGQRTEVFQSKLLDLDAEKQYQYYRGIGVFDLPDKSLVAHVDGIKVKQLVEIQPKSLNLRNLGHQLGFSQ